MIQYPLGSRCQFEWLETRRLCSGTPLTISESPFDGGTQLHVRGAPGNDRITVRQTPQGLLIHNMGGWSATYAGPYTRLVIRTGGGNDSVTVDPSVSTPARIVGGRGNDTLRAGSGNDTLLAGGGNDLLIGGSGNDQLVGGAGNDTLRGGSGESLLSDSQGNGLLVAGGGQDTLVSIGGNGQSTLVGGSGSDSFWVNAGGGNTLVNVTPAETAAGAVHDVNGFAPYTIVNNGQTQVLPIPQGPLAEALPEPVATVSQYTDQDFSSDPLFSAAGPSPNDIKQGYVGDCYYLAALASVAQTDPNLIRQSVAALGDGTYVVQFIRNQTPVFVRVDGMLPALAGGTPAYAGLGIQDSLWVAIMEKAYTIFRDNQGTYASLNGGWMSEVYAALGKASTSTFQVSSAQALLSLIQSDLAAGQAVTWGTGQVPAGSLLIGDHAYSVDAVVTDAAGNATGLTLRNPWGVDGTVTNDGSNDGYVTLTPDQAFANFLGIVAATV